ncbi:hypothetical protein HFD88_008104 [Aspergillus terreus]|nr:hypothetical protein HFD88_008104 [Aspergillus terreus]
MRRRGDPSKGEHYQWESFPPHGESDRQTARETLLSLQELHPGMRQPRTRSGREEIIRILTEAIEEYKFPPFVRYGYEDAPDAALNALYQAYIKLRSNLASRLMQQTAPSPSPPTRRTPRTPRLNYSLLSPEAEPRALKHEPSDSDPEWQPNASAGDETVSSHPEQVSSPQKPPSPAPVADPSPTLAMGNSIPNVIIQVRRAGIPLAHNEPIPPEHVSFELWTQFLKMDCDYKEGTEEVRPLDANGQALAPVRTPNRLRFLLLQATGHTLVFEIVASCPMTERRRSRNQRRLVTESV